MSATEANPILMVVDISEDIRDLTRIQLASLGCRVVGTAEGKDALELASKECLALILPDLTMPVLDGFEATRECVRCSCND